MEAKKINWIKKSIQRYVLRRHPEMRSLLTNKILLESAIFADGFNTCLMKMGEEPMQPKDIDSLLLDETVTFVMNKLNEKARKT